MSYFKTSYSTLQRLAKAGRYEYVAGFLVLARHASGRSHAGFEPYKLSGAGANSIHEKVGVSEEVARGVIEHLREQGVVRPATPEAKKNFFHARWEIVQGELDLDLPHAFVDSSKDGTAESVLRRVRRYPGAQPEYSEKLSALSDMELRLDSLMLLLAIYKHTSMRDYGGVSPRCVYRKWNVLSQTPKLGGIRWGAMPDGDRVYFDFMAECLRVGRDKQGAIPEEHKPRFWNAWKTVQVAGLIYEAVSLFDALPEGNELAKATYTLRVNDFHAGSVTKSGDPSLLRSLEITSGASFAFYTPPENPRGEPEAMWVILPDKRGAIVGIWRPRFRASNQDAGVWFEKETKAVDLLAESVGGNASSTGQGA